MRLVASAVLATLVTLILFYAMQRMIADEDSEHEKPPSVTGLRFVQVEQVSLSTPSLSGRQHLSPPPDFTGRLPTEPAMTFDSTLRPELPPQTAAIPNLPVVKPGGKPYLGAYQKPRKDKTGGLSQAKTPDQTVSSRTSSIHVKSEGKSQHKPRPQKTLKTGTKTILPSVAKQALSTNEDLVNRSINEDESGSINSNGSGIQASPGIRSGSIVGSNDSRSGGIEEEVVALMKTVPEYPRKAARNGEEGWVKIEFTITAQGEVIDPKVVASQPRRIFDRAALKAIRKWRFKPKTVDGVAVPRRATQVVEFSLASG